MTVDGLIIGLLMIPVLILLLDFLFRPRHKWEYRNPYARSCKKCHRQENVYSDGFTEKWEEIVSGCNAPCESIINIRKIK